jgi:hypothetical protein
VLREENGNSSRKGSKKTTMSTFHVLFGSSFLFSLSLLALVYCSLHREYFEPTFILPLSQLMEKEPFEEGTGDFFLEWNFTNDRHFVFF